MAKDTYKLSFLSCWLIMAFFCFGCGASARKQNSPSAADVKPSPVSQQDPADALDPLCCSPYASEGLKKAWLTFIQDGRYRLARKNAFEYIWGDLGYDFDPNYKHLAALVVDTTRTDPNRYSVVIFSSPNGANGQYKQYWLYRDRDTPNTEISRASGYLFVDGCSVRWNRQRKQYACS